ncbi:E3 ubiquitin ligase [Tilletia horrida]|nr:E3 ubiquitin ligase [Tilletia horrida]
MPAHTSSSGGRKRPASPSPSRSQGPATGGPAHSSSSSQDAGSATPNLKRQRLSNGRGRSSSAVHHAPADAGSVAWTEGGPRTQPLVEASNVPQQPSEAAGQPRSSGSDNKGKGREVSREATQRTLCLRPGDATAASDANPASADSSPVAHTNPAAAITTNGHALSTRAASTPPADALGPSDANASAANASEEFTADGPEQESRETLVAQIKMLERRLQASERQNQAHARMLTGLHERCSCDICFDLMTKPCVVAPCGHIACRECLVAYWKQPSPDEGPLRDGLSEGERQRVERNRTLARTKRCPVCRSECSRPPAEAWLMKQIVGDIERWRSVEDRSATQEVIRRSREDEAEAERRRQERTNREAGPSRLHITTNENGDRRNGEASASVQPTTRVQAPAEQLADQLKERAARLKRAETAKQDAKSQQLAEAAASISATATASASASASASTSATATNGGNGRASMHNFGFPDFESSADEGEERGRGEDLWGNSFHRPGGSQASQAEIVTSARAEREAQMGEEIWADIFRTADERRAMHWDPDDQIFRCPECLHELTNRGFCELCSLPLRRPRGEFDEVDRDDVRRIMEHRQDRRGWAADSDEDSYSVEHYDPSSPELEGPWLEDGGEAPSEGEEGWFPDDDNPRYILYRPSDLDDEDDGADLDDFIVDDYGHGHDDDEDEDEEDADEPSWMPQVPFHHADDDDDDEEEEDDDEDDRLRAAIRAQRLARVTSSMHRRLASEEDEEDEDGEDEEDEDEAPILARRSSRFANLLPMDEEDDDDDEARRWADDHLYDDPDDEDAEPGAVKDEDEDEQRAYLYPEYQDSEDSDLTPPPEIQDLYGDEAQDHVYDDEEIDPLGHLYGEEEDEMDPVGDVYDGAGEDEQELYGHVPLPYEEDAEEEMFPDYYPGGDEDGDEAPYAGYEVSEPYGDEEAEVEEDENYPVGLYGHGDEGEVEGDDPYAPHPGWQEEDNEEHAVAAHGLYGSADEEEDEHGVAGHGVYEEEEEDEDDDDDDGVVGPYRSHRQAYPPHRGHVLSDEEDSE